MNSGANRRSFLKSCVVVGAGAAMFSAPLVVPRTAFGAAERIRIGLIGCGRRAGQMVPPIPEDGKVVAVCDCFLPRAEDFNWRYMLGAAVYQDYRKLLDDNIVDTVMIAARTQSRVSMCLRALKAGVDVYAEKPLTLTVEEGRILADAARKSSQVFQVGTQTRSIPLNRWMCDFIRKGGIGKVQKVLCVNQPGPIALPELRTDPQPQGLDWDLWVDQAPLVPFNATLFSSPIRYRPFDGLDVANWVHALDAVQWYMNLDDTGPTEVVLEEKHTGTPMERPVHLRYANGFTIEYNVPKKKGPDGGCILVGEQCKVELNFNKFVSNPPDFFKEAPEPMFMYNGHLGYWTTFPHLKNWLECIKNRKTPNAPVEAAHRSTTLCHLINISRQLGRNLAWDAKKERFVDDAEADKLLSRPRRNGFELPT